MGTLDDLGVLNGEADIIAKQLKHRRKGGLNKEANIYFIP
jgi:hypothetical protein